MDLTPGMKALSPWWGTIQSAVWQKASTAELWSAVREAASSEGYELHGATAADMSRLRGIAAEQRRALEEFSSLRPSGGLEPSMVARDINSRSIGEQNLAPAYVVRFEWETMVGEARTIEWKSSVWTGYLPPTKADLLDQLNADAEQLAEQYQQEHVGIGDVLLTAV